jgi:protein tyrosine phosphatase (PTP) superfamily phosphohydrolase (DUF442 family)
VDVSDPTDIVNWRRLSDRITTSGQPSEAQLAALAALGVRHVVNLGLHSHENALPDEAASVGALGMTYTHMPVDFGAPTEADYARFREVLAGLEGETVHVHCIMNFRVSAFFYRYRRAALGEAAARAEMESVWTPQGVWVAFVAAG